MLDPNIIIYSHTKCKDKTCAIYKSPKKINAFVGGYDSVFFMDEDNKCNMIFQCPEEYITFFECKLIFTMNEGKNQTEKEMNQNLLNSTCFLLLQQSINNKITHVAGGSSIFYLIINRKEFYCFLAQHSSGTKYKKYEIKKMKSINENENLKTKQKFKKENYLSICHKENDNYLMEDEEVVLMNACKSYVLIFTSNGRLLSGGTPSHYATGNIDSVGDDTLFSVVKDVEFLKTDPIISLQCASSTSVFLTKSGALYGCGFNEVGTIGLGNTKNITTYQKINFFEQLGEPVQSFSLGYYHNFFRTKNNNIYTCGYDINGQQGFGTTNTRSSPVFNEGASNVIIKAKSVDVYGGGHHTFIVCDKEKIHACGKNDYNQIFTTTASKHSFSSIDLGKFVENIEAYHVKNIAVGFESSIVLFELKSKNLDMGNKLWNILNRNKLVDVTFK
ncbi:hypothetical protein ABK040_010849 [Willaertia magna]